MSAYIKVYRSINGDITIGNYTHKELMLPAAIFLVTNFFHMGMLIMIAGLIVSFYLMMTLKELNETKIKGYYRAFLWWYGLQSGDYKTFPKSYEREFWR